MKRFKKLKEMLEKVLVFRNQKKNNNLNHKIKM